MTHKTTLLETGFVTHDVKRYLVTKPDHYSFVPGQAVHLSIDAPGLSDDFRPFTFTSQPDDKILEFTIKSYHDHNGVTHALWDQKPGMGIHIKEPMGALHYEKPGVFLAAGTGITPFLSIFRTLWAKGELHGSTLLYTNKTKADIICEHELTHYFTQQGNGLLLTLTRKDSLGYVSGRLTKQIIQECLHTNHEVAYICGPRPFVADMKEIVTSLGMKPEEVIVEK